MCYGAERVMVCWIAPQSNPSSKLNQCLMLVKVTLVERVVIVLGTCNEDIALDSISVCACVCVCVRERVGGGLLL
jgi:hypothetical protein